MNDAPTPETDKAVGNWNYQCHEVVQAWFARKLERERDSARLALQSHFDHFREWSIPGTLYNQVQQALKGDAK